MTTAHTLTPLRQFRATAPSGGQTVFIKFSELDYELAFYHGLLTEAEDGVWWLAKLQAEKSGIVKWDKARALLLGAGWTLSDDEP